MSLKQGADQLLQGAVSAGRVAGVVAMAANREGTIYEGAFGERVLGGGQPMTTDTVGWIASMTKAITSVAAVQCVERGKLTLDTPASAIVNAPPRCTYFLPRACISNRPAILTQPAASRPVQNIARFVWRE